MPYLDVIRRLKESSNLPIAAYHVSGEYAMMKAAVERGWLEEREAVLEVRAAPLTCLNFSLPPPPLPLISFVFTFKPLFLLHVAHWTESFISFAHGWRLLRGIEAKITNMCEPLLSHLHDRGYICIYIQVLVG